LYPPTKGIVYIYGWIFIYKERYVGRMFYTHFFFKQRASAYTLLNIYGVSQRTPLYRRYIQERGYINSNYNSRREQVVEATKLNRSNDYNTPKAIC